MKYKCCLIFLSMCFVLPSFGQLPKLWTDADRNYLIEQLSNSRNELVKETAHLTDAQWNFKESPDRWCIKQIVEHIALWELLLQREINMGLAAGPQPELVQNAKQDSMVYSFITEEKQHITTDYTKPFTFSVPLGLNDGENSMTYFLKMRDESLAYLKTTTDDLRYYFLKPGRSNVHQVFITTFGHTLRHIRQIKKVKLNPGYPE